MSSINKIKEPDHGKFKVLWPNGPRNRTDLHVVFDPVNDHMGDFIAIHKQTSEKDPSVTNNSTVESSEGIINPIIKFNNIVLNEENIYFFKLYSKNFLPEIELIVKDVDSRIRFMDTPGMNNVISIALTHPSNGVYKKVSLNFYITSFKNDGNYIHVECSFKFPYLDKIITRQIKSVEDKQLITTYEFLERIAKDAGLGFATTCEVKEIRDNIYRRLESEKIKDAIPKHIEWAGYDENTYMVGWLDWYGYIDLLNISWLFREVVPPDEMSLVSHYGNNSTENTKDTVQQDYEITRVITNSHDNGSASNMQIRSYEQLTNPGDSYYNGTLETHYSVSMQANGGSGNYEMYQIQCVENSVDGKNDVESYTFENIIYDGFEMNQNRSVLKQQNLRNKWMEKQHSRVLHVTLENPNYGIQRGMIIGVILTTSDTGKKSVLLRNAQNALRDTTTDQLATSIESFREATEVESINKYDDTPMFQNMVDNREVPIFNLCGQYYVDSVSITYSSVTKAFEHELWLIKTTGYNNLINKKTIHHTKLDRAFDY